jgi:hypothetical protein
MNMIEILLLSADGLGPGAVGVSTTRGAVVEPAMKPMQGKTQVSAENEPSDLANHHLWLEPSATDVTISTWRDKRREEMRRGRNMDPFEYQAETYIQGSGEVP